MVALLKPSEGGGRRLALLVARAAPRPADATAATSIRTGAKEAQERTQWQKKKGHRQEPQSRIRASQEAAERK